MLYSRISTTNTVLLPEENKEKYWKSRAIAMDFMFSWFIHMHCQHVKPPQIVRLSVTLFHYGVTQPVWQMLHKQLKLCLSYEKMRQFMESAFMQNTSALQAWLEERSRNCCFWSRQLCCLLQSTIICSWRKTNTLPSHTQSTGMKDFGQNLSKIACRKVIKCSQMIFLPNKPAFK